jgi:hypothetical protein
MLAPITRDDILSLLSSQIEDAKPTELGRAATAIYLIFKAGATSAPTPKPAAKKARQYKEKSVAETLKLKR